MGALIPKEDRGMVETTGRVLLGIGLLALSPLDEAAITALTAAVPPLAVVAVPATAIVSTSGGLTLTLAGLALLAANRY